MRFTNTAPSWLLLLFLSSIPISHCTDEDTNTSMLRATQSTTPATTIDQHRELGVGEWNACSGIAGTCIDVNRYSCSGGSTRTGLCPGPANIKCCPAPAGIPCSGGGRCMRTSTCSGSSRTGLCPGPSSVTCCSSAPVAQEWICCRVECAGFSVGPFGVCSSTFYNDYGPSKPHSNCVKKPSAGSGAALPGCCGWHQPFCL